MPNKKWALEEPLTFESARELAHRADLKDGASLGWGGLKLFHGTPPDATGPEHYLVKKGCVILATFLPDRTFLLPGSWRSDLSFKFISAVCPYPVRQHGQDWFLLRPGSRTIPALFVDGMSVSREEINPLILWTPAAKASPCDAAKKFFAEYVHYVCDHTTRHKVDHPSAEGCWECYFHTTEFIEGSRLPRGAEPTSVKHLFEHARAREIQPSLIWRAIREEGLKPSHHWDKLVGNSPHSEAHVHVLRDHLYAFFRRRFGQLGAYQLWVSTLQRKDDDRSSEDVGDPVESRQA